MGVWQEKLFNILALLSLRVGLRDACTDHFVNVFEDGIYSLPLLLLLPHVSDRLKGHTLQLEEDTVREVEVVLAGLNDQIDQFSHVWVIALQVERDELRDEKLEVLAHWRGQVWVDPARSQLLDSGGLARVKRDEHRNGILVGGDQLLLLVSVGDPLCEPLDEIGLVCGELLLFPAEAAAEQVVGETAQAPAALCQSKQIK